MKPCNPSCLPAPVSFIYFFWEFDAWVLYLYHFCPSLLSIELSCILSHSGIHDFVFIFILFVCVYNLMDPPSIACMSVCLVLAIWGWMTYQVLWGKLILPKQPLIVCISSSMSVALWNVPHPHQHVNWCHCATLVLMFPRCSCYG